MAIRSLFGRRFEYLCASRADFSTLVTLSVLSVLPIFTSSLSAQTRNPATAIAPPAQLSSAVPNAIDSSATLPKPTIAQVQLGSGWTPVDHHDPSLNELIYELSTPKVLRAGYDNWTLRGALLALMATQGEKPSSQALRDPDTKKWVAYLCVEVGDERAVPLLESMLGSITQPAPQEAEGTRAMYLLMRLSAYYEKKKELVAAAETQLRGEKYAVGFTMPQTPTEKVPVAGMAANRLVDAARLFQRAGIDDKAREIYARVPQYGYGWASGMALYDQATTLINQGKHKEARQLLQQPVTGGYADQIKVGLFSALGDSYYRTGDLQAAQKYSQQAINGYNALENPLQGEGLQELTGASKERIKWIAKWKSMPIMGMPNVLRFQISPSTGQTVASQSMLLHTLRSVPMTITCKDPRVKIDSSDVGHKEQWSFVKSVAIGLKLPKSASPKSFNSVLLVRSSQLPTASLQVPIRVEIIAPAKSAAPLSKTKLP